MFLNRTQLVILLMLSYLVLSSFSEDMRFRKITMSSGLSHNSVLCVAEDYENFIWIGTREGLNKYNSVDVKVYKHEFNDTLSLTNNHINCIYQTPSHDLWIGTARGLNRYDRQRDKFIQYLPGSDSTQLSNGYVRCIIDGLNKEIWVGTSFGLNILNPETGHFKKIFFEAPPTVAVNIIALFKDKRGHIWIGTKAGLYVYVKSKFKKVVVDQNLNNNSESIEIRDIKQDIDGKIWIATEENGIYVMSEDNMTEISHFQQSNSEILSNHVRKMLIDGDYLWLATLDGLSMLNKNTKKFVNFHYSQERPDGISNSSLHDIIKDTSGGIWIATYTGGINYFHPQNNLFPHFCSILGGINSLNSNDITDFMEDKDENLYIGSGDAGLNLLDHVTKKITIFQSGGKQNISNNNIKSIDTDKEGNFWIGTYNGLNFFNPKTKLFKQYFHDAANANSLNNNQVHVVYVDEDGLIWIGQNGGIFQVFDSKSQIFTSFPEVGRIVTDAVFEDSQGQLWIGEREGLKCLNRKTRALIPISHLTNGLKEQLCYINWITEDKQGRIWIGTQSSGIVIFKSGKSYHFDNKTGLSDNTINAILEDNSGDFWISTNKGISKIHYSEDSGGTPYLKSINFTTIHGLQGAQFEQHSAYKSKNGKLYFGGINGYNSFFSNNISKVEYFPPIIFTDLQVNVKQNSQSIDSTKVPKSLNETEKLVLKYSERNIFLNFAGINFVNPEGTLYRYMLSGLDKKWIFLGTQNTINFTYLPVGDHELRIQASTNPDEWGKEYRKLLIQVLPPWWQTIWAYILYSLIILILLYSFFIYSQRWANLKNKLSMEQFKREKEFELNESKLKFFTDVSHELRTPLTLILAPLEKIMLQKDLEEKLTTQLQLIQRNGTRMLHLIDKVLNLRKLETGHGKLQAASGDIVLFVKEIGLAFNQIASSKNIHFEYRPSVEELNLWYDRDKMEIIIYNLLSNAIKNTPENGQIAVLLSVKDGNSLNDGIRYGQKLEQNVEIVVEDTGRGISEADLNHIFERFYTKQEDTSVKGIGVGLELTKRMVELHKGKISVESRLATPNENGLTRFSVLFPLGYDHLNEDEIVTDFKNSEDPSRYTQEIKMRERFGDIIPMEENVELPKLSGKDKQTLLIVEDNHEVRAFIRDLFLENYKIEEAANGLLGWNLATNIIPDLIISDIMMPEMDGIELCRKIKSDIRTSHIPVILLTARTTLTFKYEGLETGADEYITKPFSAQYLILKVKNLIKQRNLMRQYFERESILNPESITVTSVDERLLKKAMDYIVTNISDPSISVEKLSQELGLSRVHFYRKIKSLTNLTAVEFIRNIRLKRAANLLEQDKLTVKEVQNMVGFESADYFRNCFKEQYGCSPSEYLAQKNSDSD